MINENKITTAKEITDKLINLNNCKNLLAANHTHINIVMSPKSMATMGEHCETHCFPDELIPEVSKILDVEIEKAWAELQKAVGAGVGS